MRAIRIHSYGGPEVLVEEELPTPEPGPGEVLVRHAAVGLNFTDTYHRSGLYKLAQLPATLGVEGAGRVEKLGAGVTRLRVGDRVAYGGGPPGAYTELRTIAADLLVALPDAIPDELAAAMMLKGMTAEYLVRRCYRVQAGDTVLLHAAAGGTGQLAAQWAKELGATVIGTVSSDAKAEIARAHGCAHVVVTSKEDFVERVRAITGGRGVQCVYDSVGKDTFVRGFDCLALRGTLVSFGQSSGPIPPFEMGLISKGSYFLTRPTLYHYNARREELEESAAALFDVVQAGTVRVEAPRRYRLADAAQAHRDLEGRKTTGSVVLVP